MDKPLLSFLVLCYILPRIRAPKPGTYFWKPRLGLDLSVPTTEVPLYVNQPTMENIRGGLVVMVDGYQVGMTVIAITSGLSNSKSFPTLNPLSAYFYTNAYRWGLRYLSLIPYWLGGQGTHFCHTHRVWRRRFYYMDEFVPKWLRYMLPYVKGSEWKKEEEDHRKFKKFAESAFGRHYRFPNKNFNNFQSLETKETAEDEEVSNTAEVDEGKQNKG